MSKKQLITKKAQLNSMHKIVMAIFLLSGITFIANANDTEIATATDTETTTQVTDTKVPSTENIEQANAAAATTLASETEITTDVTVTTATEIEVNASELVATDTALETAESIATVAEEATETAESIATVTEEATETATSVVEIMPEVATDTAELVQESGFGAELADFEEEAKPAVKPIEPVKRLILTSGIKDREPVDEVQKRMVSQPKTFKLFLFTELEQYKGDHITHRWIYGERVMSETKLALTNESYRTWSSKRILWKWQGAWRIEVLNTEGEILQTKYFKYGV